MSSAAQKQNSSEPYQAVQTKLTYFNIILSYPDGQVNPILGPAEAHKSAAPIPDCFTRHLARNRRPQLYVTSYNYEFPAPIVGSSRRWRRCVPVGYVIAVITGSCPVQRIAARIRTLRPRVCLPWIVRMETVAVNYPVNPLCPELLPLPIIKASLKPPSHAHFGPAIATSTPCSLRDPPRQFIECSVHRSVPRPHTANLAARMHNCGMVPAP